MFAAKVDREIIRSSVELLGVDPDRHIRFVIDALKPYAAELGIVRGEIEKRQRSAPLGRRKTLPCLECRKTRNVRDRPSAPHASNSGWSKHGMPSQSGCRGLVCERSATVEAERPTSLHNLTTTTISFTTSVTSDKWPLIPKRVVYGRGTINGLGRNTPRSNSQETRHLSELRFARFPLQVLSTICTVRWRVVRNPIAVSAYAKTACKQQQSGTVGFVLI